MDWRSKPCTTTSGFTSLPDELLIRILSLLPTKDAAATCVLSKGLSRLFPLITILDFDDSSMFRCLDHSYAIERFPSFVTFVDNVILAHQSRNFTRFRLRVGDDFRTIVTKYLEKRHLIDFCDVLRDVDGSGLRDLKCPLLNAWISFSLISCSLRELDLCIWVKEPGEAQLPPAIFTCKTLEVLKLDVNLGLDQVSDMTSYSLPNVKLLSLRVCFIPRVDFLPSLVSGCPLLEDLTFKGLTVYFDRISINSRSLKRLCLELNKSRWILFDHSDRVCLHTPNLEYIQYTDHLSYEFSVSPMHRLAQAELCMNDNVEIAPDPVSFTSLISSLFSVNRLTLAAASLEVLDFNQLKYHLPVFQNLNHLTLSNNHPEFVNWSNLLMAWLNCSPVLETLELQMGLLEYAGHPKKQLESEQEFFRKNVVIPSCFRYHLRRIKINGYFGTVRELIIIQFLLRHARVLEELVICRGVTKSKAEMSTTHPTGKPIPDKISMENTLKILLRASTTCSIQVL